MTNVTPVTVICEGPYADDDPLIYVVDVPDHLLVPGSEGRNLLDESFDMEKWVTEEICRIRKEDFDFEVDPKDMQIHFAFTGDLNPIFDWRD